MENIKNILLWKYYYKKYIQNRYTEQQKTESFGHLFSQPAPRKIPIQLKNQIPIKLTIARPSQTKQTI